MSHFGEHKQNQPVEAFRGDKRGFPKVEAPFIQEPVNQLI
jgi:hypothetical protein